MQHRGGKKTSSPLKKGKDVGKENFPKRGRPEGEKKAVVILIGELRGRA